MLASDFGMVCFDASYDTIGILYDENSRKVIRLLMDNLFLIAIGKSLRIKQVGLSDNEIYPLRSQQAVLLTGQV